MKSNRHSGEADGRRMPPNRREPRKASFRERLFTNFGELAFSATGVRPPARLLTAETEIGRLWGSPSFVFGPRHRWYVSARWRCKRPRKERLSLCATRAGTEASRRRPAGYGPKRTGEGGRIPRGVLPKIVGKTRRRPRKPRRWSARGRSTRGTFRSGPPAYAGGPFALERRRTPRVVGG